MIVLYALTWLVATLGASLLDPLNWLMIAVIAVGSATPRPVLFAFCTVAAFTVFHIAKMQSWWASIGANTNLRWAAIVWSKSAIGVAVLLCVIALRRLATRRQTA